MFRNIFYIKCASAIGSIIPHFPDNNQTQTMPTFEVVKCSFMNDVYSMRDDPESAQRYLAKMRLRKKAQQALWPPAIKKLVLLQAHVRGYIERVAFHDTLMCEMQDILESQDPDLEEQYDLLDAFRNRVYASY